MSRWNRAMGSRRLADSGDRDSMPYTCAAINEILRMSSIVQNGSPHLTTTDIDLDGLVIPKDSIVLGNVKRIHHDHRYWNEPHTFDPERFYDRANNKCISSNNLIPFLVGKRYCLGQTLAEKELFLFLVGLMRAFEFHPSPDHPLPEWGYASSKQRATIRSSPLYKVVLKSRK